MIYLGILLLAGLCGPGEIVVSQNRGNDASDGSAAAPVRTVTRGVALARERAVSLVRIEFGDYAEGETFPLSLPSGLELRGIGSGGTVLRANAGVLLRVEHSDAPVNVLVAGLALASAEVGIDVGAPAFSASVRMPGGPPVLLRLRGVTFAGCRTGVRAQTGAGSLAIQGTGMRAQACDLGLDAEGLGAFALRLADSSFEACRVGVQLRAAEDGDPVTYAGPGVDHTLELVRCVFSGSTQSGFERRGAAGSNQGPPYRFEDCTFRGNAVGVELQRPAADTPLAMHRSRFEGNAGFGIRASGQNGDPSAVTSIAECDFRWNGVGLHVTNSHVTYQVSRSRFVDNVGNALFLSNFMTAPLTVRVVTSLIAGNGGAGIYTMADGERLAAEVLFCTIVDNGAGGVHRKTRHSGSSNLEVRGCIVAGNAPDLEKIEPVEVFDCLIGDGSAGLERDNLAGDPGFVNAALRDYALAPGSPCIDRGHGDERLPTLDLDGKARVLRPDLGALEWVP
jgi:hypothetical protein